MSDLFAWLLVVQLMGLLAAPLAFFLFGALPDRGYAFTKPLALLLAAYLLWALGLTGVVPTLPQQLPVFYWRARPPSPGSTIAVGPSLRVS